ncbi:MAG TPA: glycosyltransferase [Polyangia bacterium]|nr:glycosyltransferase [Polyangia bacterium]
MKLLWLKNDLLHPVDKGGKIRTYELLRQLKRRHEVTYICLTTKDDLPDAKERASEYSHRVLTTPWSEPERFSLGFYLDLAKNLASPLPYVLQKYRSPAMEELIRRELTSGRHDVVICDFLTPSPNLPRDIDCATVLFEHNVESILWQRHYQNARNPAKRAYFYAQWLKMLRYERTECRWHDAVAAVSDNDVRDFRTLYGIADVYAVPTGVDTDYFSPLGASATTYADGPRVVPTRQPREPYELVFTGSMDWLANEDAILYFAESILPSIARQVPQVKVTVVGRNPTPRLHALAEKNPRVTLTGRVDDVRPYIDRAGAYIVPIRVGGGTRLKIYEAMAMQRAVISTTVGAEGLPVVPGQDLLIADAPEEFAAQVIAVLRDERLRTRLEEQARATVCARFGWEQAAEAFTDVCRRAHAKFLQRRGGVRVAA